MFSSLSPSRFEPLTPAVVEQQHAFLWKYKTFGNLVTNIGQMLFTGNKYLLPKKITVQTPFYGNAVIFGNIHIMQL
jgi:hypothetical protein